MDCGEVKTLTQLCELCQDNCSGQITPWTLRTIITSLAAIIATTQIVTEGPANLYPASTWTLGSTPTAWFQLTCNGLVQIPSMDYVLEGNVVNLQFTPQPDDIFFVQLPTI